MNRRLATLFASLLIATLPAICQTPQPKFPKPGTRVGLAEWKPTPQEVMASYWSLEPGWNTELEIRNNLAERQLTVTPVLRTAAGREVVLPDVVLASEEVTSINLQQAVAQAAPELVNRMGSFGSAAVRFAGLNDRNVFAAAMVYREGHPIDFHFDGYDAASNDGYFSGIEGIWWLPAGTSTDYLIISNPSRKPITGSLALTSASGLNKQAKLALGPLQTARIDIRETLGDSTAGDMGGVTLTFPGSEGISASEIVFDEVTGLAAIMKLFERDKDESVATHVLRAPMMALRQPDAALAYPKDTVLSPRLFLRNSGTSNLQISIAVDWRSPNSTGTYKYPALNLTSNQLRAVDLGVLQDSGAIPKDANWGNVTLSYIGKSADLVPVAVSYDSKQRYGLQSPFTEGTNRMFKGGMWHVDSTHNSLITTGNGGSETTKAQLSLFYNGGKSQYRLEKVLAPGQQLLLDVGQLIRNQEPDSDGNVIPPETMTGSYELRDLDHPAVGLLYEGKLTIDKTYGHASYGCGTCCGLYNPKLTPNPYSGPASVYNQDYYLAEEQCGGGWDDFTGSAYSWQSTNTAVATLPTSMLHTVAPGTATGSAQNLLQATHPAPRCPQAVMGGYQPVTVCPNSTTVAELDPYSVALLFPTIETGIGAIATMVVAPSTPNNTAISEAFSPVSNSCPTTPPWPASLCPVPGPPFQVGQGAQGGVSINGVVYNFGPFYPGTPNTFYDQHTVTWTGSLLDSTGTRTCTATCTQTYSCSGVPVGSHTVTVTFIKAQVNGTNVTDTEFSKQ